MGRRALVAVISVLSLSSEHQKSQRHSGVLFTQPHVDISIEFPDEGNYAVAQPNVLTSSGRNTTHILGVRSSSCLLDFTLRVSKNKFNPSRHLNSTRLWKFKHGSSMHKHQVRIIHIEIKSNIYSSKLRTALQKKQMEKLRSEELRENMLVTLPEHEMYTDFPAPSAGWMFVTQSSD